MEPQPLMMGRCRDDPDAGPDDPIPMLVRHETTAAPRVVAWRSMGLGIPSRGALDGAGQILKDNPVQAYSLSRCRR